MTETEHAVPLDQSLSEELERSFQSGPILELKPEGDIRFLTEEQVARFDGLKIEIFAKEHPPAHFRVLRQGKTANFRISNGQAINGDKEVLKYKKNVYRWWEGNKQALIDTWNRTRPANCPVGEYREDLGGDA